MEDTSNGALFRFRIGPRIKSLWLLLLSLSYFFLGIRFILATFCESAEFPLPSVVLAVAMAAGGFVCPSYALFAFSAAIPILSGLSRVGALQVTDPVALSFVALFLGNALGTALFQARHRIVPATLEQPRDSTQRTLLDLFGTILVVSLAVQLWRVRSESYSPSRLWNQASYGFGDPLYFLTSGFLWLQGILYFRSLVLIRGGPRRFATPVFLVYVISILFFFCCQILFGFPDRSPVAGWGFCSIFEDTSSFGSVTAALFIAQFSAIVCSKRKSVAALGALLSLGFLVWSSWSRAAWLSSALFVLVIAWLRCSKLVVITFGAVCIAAVLIINLNAQRPEWRRSPYLARLVALAKVEPLGNKSPERITLYSKAVRMIAAAPLFGHGTGSFYRKSISFARPGDLNPEQPEFAHNTLLLLAAENGIPAAVLFGLAFFLPIARKWRMGWTDLSAPRYETVVVFGASMAISAYMLTEMTSNSLNVYGSNQFFFWGLLAMIAAARQSDLESAAPTDAPLERHELGLRSYLL